ncbi:hypothetical protein G5V59_19655 [Nocardioides sp. W3-2-3]|uniref:hypothetical protein n=1 Tax=Nocardioides convexus TaxID=2712224 RepID=UPI0024189020|nr:hypothetical protein [Nocardioides convexus]NHA01315.1 hypothetical protein [Nocardioides convexus]
MKERMLAGDWYVADDAEPGGGLLPRGRPHHRLQRDDRAREGAPWRACCASLLGAVGEDTAIRPPLQVDYGTQIRVGARTFANYGLVALDVAEIVIGDDVQIGPNVQPAHPDPPAGGGPAP